MHFISEPLVKSEPLLKNKDDSLLVVRSTAVNATSSSSDVDIDSTTPCKLELYPSHDFVGDPSVLDRSSDDLRIEARSARAIGACSWNIYSGRHFEGKSVHIDGGQEMPRPSR